ncbi:MAG TPA: class I SAM-dependent methyltransferase, partial [Blastocatellia bacterium]|nr:class I SAM-dependent methyltransferase [Blastocatellia bacterium]
MMSQVQTNDTLREYSESAPYWEKHAQTIRAMYAPLTSALTEEAGITRGWNVLDVAGGSGEPSLTIAEVVGPSGSVTCTDAVAKMAAAAGREARRRGLTNVKFRQCAADALPFAGNTFDAVVSRLGAMFFPDPLRALREMLRVTRPGGALSLAVWHRSDLNPFFSVVTGVMARHVETPPADPGAPGAFRFAAPGALACILEEAGATDVRERLLEFRIAAALSPAEFWTLRSEISGTLREKLALLSAEKR